MAVARRNARQHEPRPDSRPGGLRTQQLPDGAAVKINLAIGMLALAIVARTGAEMSARPPAVAAAVNAASVAIRSAAEPPAAPAGYAGSDTCLTCHSDKGDSLKGTP